MLRRNPLRYARPRIMHLEQALIPCIFHARRLSYSRASGWIKVDEITDRYVVCDYVVGHLTRRASRSSDTLSSITLLCSRYYVVYDTSSSVIYSTVSVLSFATLSFVLLSRLRPNVLFRLNGSPAYICLRCLMLNIEINHLELIYYSPKIFSTSLCLFL